MIICPQCKASLPVWAKQCQFCGADVTKVPRPAADPVDPHGYQPYTQPNWILPAYYGIAGYLLLSGVLEITMALVQRSKDTEGRGLWMIGIFFGGVVFLLSIGLLLRVETVRKIMVWVCAIDLLFGVLGLFGSFMVMMAAGGWGVLLMVSTLLRICADGLMIYLIGETDKLPQI